MAARQRLVMLRQPADLLPLVDEVFADERFVGHEGELRPEDAVVPAIANCSE